MSLHSKLRNRPNKLRITSITKSVHIRPKTKDELKRLVDAEIERQGPDADLNFIDVSDITSMYMLFCDTGVRNIKIDEWNVSNVTDMAGMFMDCPELSADLSGWDTSNVTDMRSTFNGCCNFDCDLSNWDVSNVKNISFMFNCC